MDSSTIAPQMHGLELARVIPDPLDIRGTSESVISSLLHLTQLNDWTFSMVEFGFANFPMILGTTQKFLVVDEKPGPDFGVVKWRYRHAIGR
ncbi:MAG: hypothetical protein IPL86_07510 [Flavobacteriales bacterium]|nr:hypothetical protein [Flavobacteriales bacterium]